MAQTTQVSKICPIFQPKGSISEGSRFVCLTINIGNTINFTLDINFLLARLHYPINRPLNLILVSNSTNILSMHCTPDRKKLKNAHFNTLISINE